MKHSPQKLRAYQTLFTLNQAFENVLADLHRLQRLPFFRREFLREFQVMVEETRACVNFELVEALHSREQDDWTRFGRLRQQWEKRYRDPNDALIEAERLKKLRKSAGKRGKGGSHASWTHAQNTLDPPAVAHSRPGLPPDSEVAVKIGDRGFWDGMMFGFTASLTLWQDLPPIQVIVVMIVMLGAAMVVLGGAE